MHTKPLVIANANHISTLLPIRVLGRRCVPIIPIFGTGGLDQYASIVRSSRYVKNYHTFDESDYAANLVQCLLNVGKSIGEKSVLMAGSDKDMIIVSEFREILSKYYLLIMPPHETLRLILNKQHFYPEAHKRGLPVPKTFYPSNSDEIHAVSKEIHYPCIIKPPWRDVAWQVQYRNRKVVVANNAQELISTFDGIFERFNFLSVQEVVLGSERDIVCSFSFLDENSNPLFIFTSNKARQYPPDFGNSSLVERVSSDEVVELTKNTCRKLGLAGYTSIEFKKDSRDGKYKIIEITPCRFNRQTGLSEVAGISIPHIWYSYLVGEPYNTDPNDNFCKWISEVNEFRGFWAYLRRREYSLSSWIKSYRGLKMGEIFSGDDPVPILMLLPNTFMQTVKRSRRKKAS